MAAMSDQDTLRSFADKLDRGTGDEDEDADVDADEDADADADVDADVDADAAAAAAASSTLPHLPLRDLIFELYRQRKISLHRAKVMLYEATVFSDDVHVADADTLLAKWKTLRRTQFCTSARSRTADDANATMYVHFARKHGWCAHRAPSSPSTTL